MKLQRFNLIVSGAAILGVISASPASADSLSDMTDGMDSVPTVTQLSSTSVGATNTLEQVTSVSQLTDVRPTDWAFQALQSLVERYGCIVGYPDRTYRGNRALSRYEFAAGLNACLDKIQELIAAATADFVRREDLEVVKRLQEEFAAELATLRGRVDVLDVRTATLEKQQFSFTTKLNGEVVFGLASIFSGDDATGQRISRNTIFGDRVRLNFDSTFTGEDLLRTRLQATNLNAFSGTSTFTPMGDLRWGGGAFEDDNNNSVEIDALLYQFPVGEKLTVSVLANAGAADDFMDTLNPYFDGDGGTGALSHFATRNPVYYLLDGTGLAFRYAPNDAFSFSAGYLASDAANPAAGAGLFNGPYGAIAQLTIQPSEAFSIGFTYVHAYNNDFTANGPTGSNRANLRSALLSNPNLPGALAPFAGVDIPTVSNAYGVQASLQLSPRIVINGFGGYVNTRTVGTGGVLPRGELDIWTWGAGVAFPDLLRAGSVGGIFVGMEPRVTRVSPGLRGAIGRDPNASLHVEAFYQYRVNDNIAITPGIVWLTAPDMNNNNSDVVIGTIRTTFTF